MSLSFRNGAAIEKSAVALQRHGGGYEQIPPSGRNDKYKDGTPTTEDCGTADCDLSHRKSRKSLPSCHSDLSSRNGAAVEKSAVALQRHGVRHEQIPPSGRNDKCKDGTLPREDCGPPDCDLSHGKSRKSLPSCHSDLSSRNGAAVEKSAVACSATMSATSRFLPPVGMTIAKMAWGDYFFDLFDFTCLLGL